MSKDVSKSRIHAATTYKLYVASCLAVSSGFVLMLKFPEMHSLPPGIEPLSFAVYGLSLKAWKIIHIVSALAFALLTVVHIYYNREWIMKVGSKKLSLGMTIGLALGTAIVLLGLFAPSA